MDQVTPSTADATTNTEQISPINGHVDIALLATINNIVVGVSRRLNFIGYDDTSNDAARYLVGYRYCATE